MPLTQSRSELESEISRLLIGRDMNRVKDILRQQFRVDSFRALNTDELKSSLVSISTAIANGEL